MSADWMQNTETGMGKRSWEMREKSEVTDVTFVVGSEQTVSILAKCLVLCHISR
jgi:hypothetical protein